MVVNVEDHYDMLIDEGTDSFRDSEILKMYMSRWDGRQFYESLCLSKEKTVLEIGVGTGRVAANVLDIGCKYLTGLDISPKTVERAKENLQSRFDNVEILLHNAEEFIREEYYDLVYSVLTFMHIEQKEKALSNMVRSLKSGGDIVLSISIQGEWLDYGRKIKLYPKEPKFYIDCLETLGCEIEEVIDLVDSFILPNGYKQPQYGKKIATIIKATKKL